MDSRDTQEQAEAQGMTGHGAGRGAPGVLGPGPESRPAAAPLLPPRPVVRSEPRHERHERPAAAVRRSAVGARCRNPSAETLRGPLCSACICCHGCQLVDAHTQVLDFYRTTYRSDFMAEPSDMLRVVIAASNIANLGTVVEVRV